MLPKALKSKSFLTESLSVIKKNPKYLVLVIFVLCMGMMVVFFVQKKNAEEKAKTKIEEVDAINDAIETTTNKIAQEDRETERKRKKLGDTYLKSAFTVLPDKEDENLKVTDLKQKDLLKIPKRPMPALDAKNNLNFGSGRKVQEQMGITVNAIIGGKNYLAILSDGTVVQVGSRTNWGIVQSINSEGIYIGDKFLGFDRSFPRVKETVKDDLKETEQNKEEYLKQIYEQNMEIEENINEEKNSKQEKTKETKKENDGITVQELNINDKMRFGGQK